MVLAHLGGAVKERAEAWAEVAAEWEEHDPGLGPVGIASVPIAAPELLIK